MKIVSWNVNGIRAVMKKEFAASLRALAPDIICLQETKAQEDQVREALAPFADWKLFANSAQRKGYSGTAILTKIAPLEVQSGIGIEEHDLEGRLIAAEFDDFILVTVYTPNSGSELARLDYRAQWDSAFLKHMKIIEKKKPLLLCGDFNVAHQALDLARPKENYNKSAGYMQSEIDGMQACIDAGFVDTFRLLHPDTVKYSWWSYRAGAREKNVGWRIDYFLASTAIKDKITSAEIHNEIEGSDHCPVSVELA